MFLLSIEGIMDTDVSSVPKDVVDSESKELESSIPGSTEQQQDSDMPIADETAKKHHKNRLLDMSLEDIVSEERALLRKKRQQHQHKAHRKEEKEKTVPDHHTESRHKPLPRPRKAPPTQVISSTSSTRMIPIHVIITGLPDDMTEQVARQLCEEFGDVESLVVPVDSSTRAPYGRVDVIFASVDGARYCVKRLNGANISGRSIYARIDVKDLQKMSEQSQSSRSGKGMGQGYRGRPRGRGRRGRGRRGRWEK
eukprot:gnl/Carplike_NY0171/4111_a5560_299.p1 GENE.gnl/Carplike_NY0171/4111_a5560_299~~gnl/Carplike_NY0171/4111_a5560_299.p1  ORF type:complete len:253 (-),score=64.16 gnl/Carplike_NY0171/4111_a5560_299:708-1466(-)